MNKITHINVLSGDEWDGATLVRRAESIAHGMSTRIMDQERIKKILEIAGRDDQLKIKVLHNAVVRCLQDYNAESTAARLKDWQAAEQALAELLGEVERKSDPDASEGRSLSSIVEVLRYLKENGWKVTKTSLYRHQGEGKLLPKENGSFRRKDVDKYAKTFLKEQSTGKKVKELEDALQRKKIEAELRNLDLEHERKKLAHDRELGKYILREKMEIELAARAGILEAGLKHWIQSRVADWIRTTNGDIKKAGEMINSMIRDLDEHINSYAQAKEFELVIDGEEEEGESPIE